MDETGKQKNKKLDSPRLCIIKDNITSLDLSNSKIKKFSEALKLPLKLTELNLSHNDLENVPDIIFGLKYIKIMDISFNNIQYFDKTPSFCHNIENINISNNNLQGPPAWIWFNSSKKLSKLDISCNIDLTNSFKNGYFEELIKFKTCITEVKIYNCRICKFIQLLVTFPKARLLEIGSSEMSYLAANSINDLPCEGLIECCDLEYLNIIYTNIFTVTPNIVIHKRLIEINLSHNELSTLPNEFCMLENLEVCILSCNNIIYLPDDFGKLEKLHTLCIDSNELCMLPVDISNLRDLKKLDLYDNYLCELPLNGNRIQEIDLAQNYLEEPEDDDYLIKKQKLRLNIHGRWDGRKYEKQRSDSFYNSVITDDENYYLLDSNDVPDNENRPPSSVEDWDSDEYWVPYINSHNETPQQSPWLQYVYWKMKEGNFCPMDNHIIPVTESVQYDKLCNPQIQYESDGQFDDYSSDDC